MRFYNSIHCYLIWIVFIVQGQALWVLFMIKQKANLGSRSFEQSFIYDSNQFVIHLIRTVYCARWMHGIVVGEDI